jgi:hypothetical protein
VNKEKHDSKINKELLGEKVIRIRTEEEGMEAVL